MEMNPIFRLELIQTRRGYILLFLFVGGCLAQAAELFLRRNLDWVTSFASSIWIGFYLINLFFMLLPIFIVGWAPFKLAAQQFDDDPVLHTPLSPRTVLAGKLQAVFAMISVYVSREFQAPFIISLTANGECMA